MVDIVSGIYEAVGRHRLEDLVSHHSVEDPVTLICVMRLDSVHASLCKVQSHRPVVRDRVDDVFHAAVERRLSRPYMRSDDRNILRDVPEHRSHELRVLLVRGVVCELSESLIVHRFPYELVEKLRLLGDPGSQRIQIVLGTDDLCARCCLVGVEVHPVGLVSERIRCGGYRHRYPVMAESHSDISYDDALFRVESEVIMLLVDSNVLDSDDVSDMIVRNHYRRIVFPGIIPELSDVLFLGLYGFCIVSVRNDVSENLF